MQPARCVATSLVLSVAALACNALTPPAPLHPLRPPPARPERAAGRDGPVRVNFLLRTPYAFPVAPSYAAHAGLRNSAGEVIRERELYFLDRFN